MIVVTRNVLRTLVDLSLYASRTGRWWVPVLTVVLAVATVLILVIKTVVPAAVYVLF